MKSETKRGRPRKFDEARTLDLIMRVFWEYGYSATSLDQIAATTGLNRPSLYAAFGSKKDMYLTIIDRFTEKMEAHVTEAVLKTNGANSRMKAAMRAAIELYSGQTDLVDIPAGCLAISTLPSEAMHDEDIQKALQNSTDRMDQGFTRVILTSKSTSFSENEARQIAVQLAIITQGLSIRARSGTQPEALKNIAFSAVDKLLPV